MPAVSVIIPTYGHAQSVCETLNSVFQQTFQDFEVLVINDGSPDNTAEVLKPYVAEAKIRYFEKQNGGVASARNFGISKSQGTYIALLDDDDLWPPDKLEWQVMLIEKTGAAAVGGVADFFGSENISTNSESRWQAKDVVLGDLFEGNPFASPGQVLIRRSAIGDQLRFDSGIWGADDLDFWFGLVKRGSFILVNRAALHYRIHPGNASNNIRKMLENCNIVLQRHLVQVRGKSRSRYERAAYRWLFGYVGIRVLSEASFYLVQSRPQPRRAFGSLALLARAFALPMLKDLGLAARFGSEFTRLFILAPTARLWRKCAQRLSHQLLG